MNIARRHFLKTGAALAASASWPGASHGQAASDQIRLGMIGCGDRGRQLYRAFAAEAACRMVALADPDRGHLQKMNALAGGSLAEHVDYRDLLERKDVDAVVIATPNHWHALQTIHACQAGKDVYVEKPVTFNVDEGAAVLAAAAKHGRIVQAGTQNRSDVGLKQAVEFVRSGKIGAIRAIRGLCYRNRESIGRLKQPLTPPAELDYNLWLGGARDLPILRPSLHYDWHWDFNTGNGDIGNQGPHEMDLITWFLGDPAVTGTFQSVGNRFAWDDAGNTPNMLTTWFELGGVPVIFETNNLWVKPSLNSSPAYKGTRVGVVITCEGGEFIGGRGGGYIKALDSNEKLHKFPGDGGANHQANFLEAVRTRDPGRLNAPLAKSVNSALLAHLANLSWRAGGDSPRPELDARVPASVLEVLDRQEIQFREWSVDTKSTPHRLGAEVAFSPEGRLTGPDTAIQMGITEYRKGFELPKS